MRGRGAQQRDCAECERDDDRDAERKEERRRIDADLADAWQIAMVKRDHRIDRPKREYNSQHGGAEREQNCFHQVLTQQTPARGAQCSTDRHLFASRRRADHQQIGDVGTRNQKQQCNRAAKQQQRATDIFNEPFAERSQPEAGSISSRAVLSPELLTDCGDFRGCLRLRNGGANPSDGAKIVTGS